MLKRLPVVIPVLIMSVVIVIALIRLLGTVSLSTASPSRIATNEAYIQDVQAAALNLDDLPAVFRHVFSQLPAHVTVYPTENYYYFRFFAGAHEIWGNMRLDVDDRKNGLMSFAYFEPASGEMPTQQKELFHHKNLGPEDGVVLQEIDPNTFRVTFDGHTTIFHLNVLPQSVPAGMTLREGERFLFRTMDESGFQLVLLVDDRKPAFRFVLDPEAPRPDTLDDFGGGLHIGRRSGFAFFRDDATGQMVLFGVSRSNIRGNNYYDGPFDQLADNILADTSFKEDAERIYRSLRIDRRGFFLDENGEKAGNRLAVQPYLSYQSLEQLRWYVWYCQQPEREEEVVACLTRDPNIRE